MRQTIDPVDKVLKDFFKPMVYQVYVNQVLFFGVDKIPYKMAEKTKSKDYELILEGLLETHEIKPGTLITIKQVIGDNMPKVVFTFLA